MPSDEEDFVFYGTPIEREEDITTRKKKAVAEASGQLRTALPPWKQEVTDEEGRRRFHGAFTGGYSAGFYNTVGSKEGWTPQSFTSSRKKRAEVQQQNIFSFLDEDEKSELEGRSLGTSMQFDTFGFTAAEIARKQAEKEQQQWPSAIPGPVPDELIAPVTESIGVKLLLKMGWRQGRSIKDSNKNSLNVARRQARKAFLALSQDKGSDIATSKQDEGDSGDVPDLPADDDNHFTKSTPEYVLNPKQDLHGLGYDPFKQAPEFREKKRQKMAGKRETDPFRSLTVKRKAGPGFGIGALEDLDAEDEDVYDSGIDFQVSYVQEIEEPSSTGNVEPLRILNAKKDGVLPGFKAASKPEQQFERFDPPSIPKDFVPHHKFPAPLENDGKIAEFPPAEVPQPEDNNLKVLIEGVATLVARCGKLFEDLSREKNQSNPLFDFLRGGNGSDYYQRKLWEARQKRGDQIKLWEVKKPQSSEKLTAEKRGAILGEKALERSLKSPTSSVASVASVDVQIKLSDTFTKPASANEQADVRKPFHDDPAKQIRFEQFLKEKYEGGLRTKDSGGSVYMSEAERAREKLEFETAANAIEKEKLDRGRQASDRLLKDMPLASGLQFTSGGVEINQVGLHDELIAKAMYPKREEFQWRPAPLLCKRFDLIDPYMGKPPPAPRPRSKIDSLIFMPDSIKNANVEEQSLSSLNPNRETTGKEVEDKVEVENVERPVDLYKAIFSDDEDEEEENNTSNQVEDPQTKIEVANTTLNRLIAGDFLESLGKELGLSLPPEMPPPVAHKEAIKSDNGKTTSTNQRFLESSTNGENTEKKSTSDVKGPRDRTPVEDDRKVMKALETERYPSSRKTRNGSSSSSGDERGRKKLRSHRHKSKRSSSSDSDTSNDSRHRLRSRKDEKGSSREKSRKHSKHRKHRRRDSSPSRSHRSSEHEKRKRRKSRYNE